MIKPKVSIFPAFNMMQGRFRYQARVRMPNGRVVWHETSDGWSISFLNRGKAYAAGVKLALEELKRDVLKGAFR